MSPAVWAASVSAGLAAWCLVRDRPRQSTSARPPAPTRTALLLAAGAALAAGLVVWWWALPVFVAARWWLRRSNRPVPDAAALRDIPHLVSLMAGPLRAGVGPAGALRRATRALPGPAADRLADPLALLQIGVAPETVWADLAASPDTAELGRAMLRAHRSGARISETVEQLADELAARAAAVAEDRARTVGVRAAVPLGLCLLPAFLLLGVVPLAVGLFAEVLG